MRRSPLALLAVTIVSLWAVPAAGASTVTDNFGQELRIAAGAGETNGIVVTVTGTSATITDTAGIGVGSPAGSCTPNPPNEVNCANVLTSQASRVVVTAGDLNDTVTLSVTAVSLPQIRNVTVDGNSGNDTIDASASGLVGHQIAGSEGDDTIIGGPFGDILNRPVGTSTAAGPTGPTTGDDPGNDRVTGGGGDDRIGAASGADVVDAGEGHDFIETLVSGPNASMVNADLQDDGAIDTISCGGQVTAPGSLPRPPSAQGDTAQVGLGDIVAGDCEFLGQFVECPSGASCAGDVSVEAGGAGASSALASVSKKKKGKKKPLVLGKQKVKLAAGKSMLLNLKLQTSKVNKVLSKSAQVPATMRFNVKRIKKGKQVGKLKKRVRFKLKR